MPMRRTRATKLAMRPLEGTETRWFTRGIYIPQAERWAPPNTGNAKTDQKYQKQQEDLARRQDQERQKLQQRQDKEHVQYQKQANEARTQQMEQRHAQQTQQLQQRQAAARQQMQQQQAPQSHGAEAGKNRNTSQSPS